MISLVVTACSTTNSPGCNFCGHNRISSFTVREFTSTAISLYIPAEEAAGVKKEEIPVCVCLVYRVLASQLCNSYYENICLHCSCCRPLLFDLSVCFRIFVLIIKSLKNYVLKFT